MTAQHYAKALFELVEREPAKGKQYIKNLKLSLAKRGYQKLMPRIVTEFQNLEVARQRMQKHTASTPKSRQQQALVELYRKLIS